ncbi:MAG: hypothetical protein JWO09_2291 [Bacteroidetes bacterium]|nr:hypothetical protein [Bacteroidota bacterium]
MPIYTEKTANSIPVPAPPSPAPTFICDYTIGSDKYERLREFILLIYNNKGKTALDKNDPVDPDDNETFTFPHSNLWDDFFRHIVVTSGGIPTLDTNGLPLLLPLPLSDSVLINIPNNYASEAATIFAYFYCTLNLALDTQWELNQNTPGLKYYQTFDYSTAFQNPSEVSYDPLKVNIVRPLDTTAKLEAKANDPNKSYIFKLLRTKISEYGIMDNSSLPVDNKVLVNSLLNPVASILHLQADINHLDTLNKYDTGFQTSFYKEETGYNTKYKTHFFTLFHALINPDHHKGVSAQFVLNTGIMDEMYFNDAVNTLFRLVLSRNDDLDPEKIKSPEFKIRTAFYIAEHLYKSLSDIINKYIDDEIDCFFKGVMNTTKKPEARIIATGDGSSSKGILGLELFGVLLFNYSFYSYEFGKVLPTNEIFDLKQDKKSVVHFKIFGLDAAVPSKVVITSPTDPNETFTLTANVSSPDLVLSTSGTSIEFVGNLIKRINNDGSKTPLAIFDSVKQNLKYLTDEPKRFNIKLESAQSLVFNAFEEVQLLVSVVEEFNSIQILSSPMSIEVQDKYSDDKFELEKAEIDKLLTTSQDISTLKHLVELLKTTTPPAFNYTLSGQFVGKLSGETDSKVKADPDYIPDNSTTNIEAGIAGPDYEKFRYSFGTLQIAANGSSVSIVIDSWVSPLRSRLDDRFTKNTAQPHNDGTDYDWDYRNDVPPVPPPFHTGDPSLPGGSAPSMTLLNSFTLPGYNLAITVSSVTYYIKSYNQALACLRSLGTLEAVFYRLYDVWIGAHPSEATLAATTLKAILNSTSTVVESYDKTGTVRGFSGQYELSSPITYADFKALKWYRLFKTTYKAGTNQVEVHNDPVNDNYEHFLYRHELD